MTLPPEHERRRFPRVPVHEAATAYDVSGFQLGRVTAAGGGGMQLEVTRESLARMPQGGRMRVTVIEPNGTRNSFDVEVKYIHGNSVGLEFV